MQASDFTRDANWKTSCERSLFVASTFHIHHSGVRQMCPHLGKGAAIVIEDIVCEGIVEASVGILPYSLDNGTAVCEVW